MGLQGVVGPNGSYTPPSSGSLTQVTSDISILETNYNNALNAANLAVTSYTNLYQELQRHADEYQNALENDPGDSDPYFSNLQSSLASFNSYSSDYLSPAETLRLAALELSNAHYSYQQLQDSQINTSLNNLVTSLNGKIDSTLYSELQTANSARQTARNSLLPALTNFQNNELLLANARALLLQQQAKAAVDRATALLTTGLEPTSLSPGSAWEQYETDMTAVTQTEALINTYLANRATYSSTLNNAISNYKDSYDNSTTGFVTILQQATTQAHVDATAYIAQIASAKNLVDNFITTSLAQRRAADLLAQQQHYAAYPSSNSNLATIEQGSNDLAATTINALLTTGVTAFGSDLSLPELPTSGKRLSMMDFMKFLTAGQLIAKQINLQSQQADIGLNDMRLEIWKAILTANNTQLSEASRYLHQLVTADREYNAQVDSENSTTQTSEQADITAYNAEVSAINNRIALINARNQLRTANGNNVTDGLNSAAQQAVNTINETNEVNPNSINILDLFDQIETVYPPTALPDPAIIPYPDAYPQFPSVPQLPSPIPTATATQGAIDAFNALLKQVNDILAPISGELDEIQSPPIDFQQLTPLFYRQDIPLRSLSDIFDITSVLNSLSSLFDLINKANTHSVLSELNKNPLFAFTSAKTAQTKGQTTQGAGGAVSLSAVNANIDSATLGQMLNQLIRSEQYGNLLKRLAEEATLVAGIQTGIRLPARDADHSVFGVMRDEFITEVTQAKDAAIASTRSATEEDGQLKAVAEQLIHQSNNVKELEQNANLIIAESGFTATLSDTDLKKLQSSLVFLQKITLLLLSGIALSSIGAKNNPATAAENFISLTQSPEVAAAAPTAALASAGSSITSTSPSELPDVVVQALQSAGLTNQATKELETVIQAGFAPAGTVTSPFGGKDQFDQVVKELKKAGFALPPELSPENPYFIQALLDQVDQKLPTAVKADFANYIALFLRSLNLPGSSIAGFKAGLASGVSIGSAVTNTLNSAVSTVIHNLHNLNVNLQAIPDNVRTKLEAQTNTALASLKNLSPSDKLSLSLAIGSGLITQAGGKEIAKSLADIATLGATPKTVSAAIGSFERAYGHTEQQAPTTTTTVPGGDPKESRHPSTMPKDTVALFHEHIAHLTIDEDDRKYLEKVTTDFGKTVVSQHDFYQFSITFLLDPAKSILKNFSMITAEQGHGSHIPPDQMRIAS